jgi:methylated-DNA-[protein]-cysteine S-methyltransferase
MNDARPERLLLEPLSTPIGALQLVTDERSILRAIGFGEEDTEMLRQLRSHYGGLVPESGPAPAAIRDALEAYFAGDIAALAEIAWATAGTPFQQKVWTALTDIPAGTTTSYGAIAARIGAPKAVRAVGLANGANPIPIVVPCHRVIGANGTLTGYGGGLERKSWLLAHEGATLPFHLSDA